MVNPVGIFHVGSNFEAVMLAHKHHVPSLHLTLSNCAANPPPFPLLKRVNQPQPMPRATISESDSESERVPPKKQKKRQKTPVDVPMDQEEEFEIEKIVDASNEIFKDVRPIRLSWPRGQPERSPRTARWRTL